MSIEDIIAEHYSMGARYVVLDVGGGVKGSGLTAEEAWEDAIINSHLQADYERQQGWWEDGDDPFSRMYDFQCFDAAPAGPLVNRFHDRNWSA